MRWCPRTPSACAGRKTRAAPPPRPGGTKSRTVRAVLGSHGGFLCVATPLFGVFCVINRASLREGRSYAKDGELKGMMASGLLQVVTLMQPFPRSPTPVETIRSWPPEGLM
jgi:hypothetical protein